MGIERVVRRLKIPRHIEIANSSCVCVCTMDSWL
jgi:hypothetical protein